MNLFADSFAQIIVDTAEDVHPPLYYFLGRIMRLLFGESLQVQKILTIIPMSLTLALGAGKIGGISATGPRFFYPVSGLPALFHDLCGSGAHVFLGAFVCDGLWAGGLGNSEEKQDFDWVWLAISAVAAAYLHYFAFVSVIVINGLLLLWLLFSKEERKKLVRWLIFSVLMVLAYLPWLPYMLEQVTRVAGRLLDCPDHGGNRVELLHLGFRPESASSDYLWVSPDLNCGGNRLPDRLSAEEQAAGGCGTEPFFGFPLRPFCHGGSFTDGCGRDHSFPDRTAIYRDQYVFPAMGLFCLFLAIGMNRVLGDGMAWLLPEAAPDAEAEHGGKEESAASERAVRCGPQVWRCCCCCAVYRGHFLSGCFPGRISGYADKADGGIFRRKFRENDLVVYNYQAYYFNYKYYFPEEKLAYVRDVDLSQDLTGSGSWIRRWNGILSRIRSSV